MAGPNYEWDQSQWYIWSLPYQEAISRGLDPEAYMRGQEVRAYDAYNNQDVYSAAERERAANTVKRMRETGAQYSFQLPESGSRDRPRISGGSFGDLVGDFVTSPAFLTLAGGVAGVYGGAAAGAAGAGEGGAAAGLTAAEEAAMLTGAGVGGGGAATGVGAGTAGAGLAAGEFGPAATTAPGEAGYLGSGTPMTSTTGATNTLPGQVAGTNTTALSRILSGSGTTQDWISLTGQVAPSLLGMYASDKQADALGGLAARYEGYGAPYRDRLAATYSDPTAFLKSPEVQVPVQMGTDALARALSTQGNPAGSGTALQTMQDYATNQYWNRLGGERDRLAGFGGLTQYASAAPGLATGAIGAQGNVYNALGAGIANVTEPPRSLADILKFYKSQQGLV